MSMYNKVKEDLIYQMIAGEFRYGDQIPTEMELCERYNLSRVTIRKALDELKKEGLIAGVPRQGTVFNWNKGGYHSSLDLIALVASVQDPFFSSFMRHFEFAAEANGSLMLFKQDFQGNALQSGQLFFRFIQKQIRNVVIWPQEESIDFELLARLRAVGMNFVLFDQLFDTDIADTVGLDNHHAVSSLYAALRAEQGAVGPKDKDRDGNGSADVVDKPVVYIGYSGLSLPSETMRRDAYVEAAGAQARTYSVPWRGNLEAETAVLMEQLKRDYPAGAKLLCNSGGIGLQMARLSGEPDGQFQVGTIDFMPEMELYDMIAIEQPMQQMAERTYQLLVAQSNRGTNWKAATYRLQGRTVYCGNTGPGP